MQQLVLPGAPVSRSNDTASTLLPHEATWPTTPMTSLVVPGLSFMVTLPFLTH